MRTHWRTAALVGRVILAAALLLAALTERDWIFYKIVDFAAFVVLAWSGVSRLAARRWVVGGLLSITALLFYPLIVSHLPREVLYAADIFAAALLLYLSSRWGAFKPLIDAAGQRRLPLYSGAVVAVMSLLLVLNVADRSFVSFLETSGMVNHTYEVISSLESFQADLERLESQQRAFVIAGNRALIDDYDVNEEQIRTDVQRIARLTRDNPQQQARVVALGQSLNRKLQFMRFSLDVRERMGFEAAQRLVGSGRGVRLMAAVTRCKDEMRSAEEQLLQQRQLAVRDNAGTARLFLWAGSTVALSLVIVLVLLIDRDLARRRATAVELRSSRDLALESARAKSAFLANMSHEIRTPMNGVIGMTNLLLDTRLNDEQREYAETVKASAEGLLAIINDILDFSKIEAGRLVVEQVATDVSEVIESVIDVVAPACRARALELYAIIAPEVPLRIVGDPVRLRQVLTNLVGNAVKFTAAGSVTIEATVVGERLRLAVIDTGIGIPADAQARLFESFVQADSSTSRRYGGTGLGLAIVRQLVELMGGEIALKSEAGKGSTFTILLPLERAAAETSAELQGIRCAVLPNGEHSAAMLIATLTRHGAVVVDDAPHVVVIDLPAASGEAELALQRARSRAGDAPIVSLAWSGSAAPPFVAVTLAKPLKPSMLLRTLGGLGARTKRIRVTSEEQPDVVSTRSTRILLAEDNAINQKVAMKQLQKLGYEAKVASNGREVLEALQAGEFDVILMDCQMPEVDGFEATRRIRASEGDGRHIVIIAMTANAMEGDRELCIAAGMDDYLSKPLTVEQLGATIARWTQST